MFRINVVFKNRSFDRFFWKFLTFLFEKYAAISQVFEFWNVMFFNLVHFITNGEIERNDTIDPPG